MGYEHLEEKIFCHNGEIVRTTTTKKYPPDVTACIFWLKNRNQAEWRDKVSEDSGGTPEPVAVTIVVKDGKIAAD